MTESLPKMLRGQVHEQPRTCGKSNCKFARGKLHTAFYRFWTEDGRQRKEYVRRTDLDATRAACAWWKEAVAAKAALLCSPEADEIRRLVRETLGSALGAQAGTAAGRRQLRRRRP